MHIVSLHPIDPETVRRYVAALNDERSDPPLDEAASGALRDDAIRARAGDERAATRLTYGLARALGQAAPIFTHDAFGLSFWEAQVDRPMGMLMRPPARLFIDAGLDASVARTMATRLDFQMGMMGGAYIPARLIDQAHQLLDDHMERSVKRLMAAEYDPMASFGLMYEAVSYARDQGMGLYEALDVIGPAGEGLPGATILRPDRKRLDRNVAERIDAYRQPPKKPGLIQRMLGRGGSPASVNGHLPEGER
ncbi:MAG: hypothetical protein M3457_22170 [Chloroflexota bacterium]|nr:hypothetical protein [Chloroflexota bacterium]